MEHEMMKWIKNIQSVIQNGDAGECPFCSSSDTDYSASIIEKETNMGYAVIWCNKCKHAIHISRMKINKEMKNGKIPDGLKY